MRKHPLVVDAAACAGVSNVLCGRIVRAVLEGIMREVVNGGEVRLGLFGSFERVELPPDERRRRSKARCAVRFRPGKTFRDALRL